VTGRDGRRTGAEPPGRSRLRRRRRDVRARSGAGACGGASRGGGDAPGRGCRPRPARRRDAAGGVRADRAADRAWRRARPTRRRCCRRGTAAPRRRRRRPGAARSHRPGRSAGWRRRRPAGGSRQPAFQARWANVCAATSWPPERCRSWTTHAVVMDGSISSGDPTGSHAMAAATGPGPTSPPTAMPSPHVRPPPSAGHSSATATSPRRTSPRPRPKAGSACGVS
jgi:hypothetical protein